MYDIICQECGDLRECVPGNTRYCMRCRILKDAEHYTEARKTCASEDCKNVFCPTDPRDRLCPHCRLEFAPAGGHGHCATCGHDDRPLRWENVPICVRCAGDENLRAKMLRQLRKGQEARRERNRPFTPGIVPGTKRPKRFKHFVDWKNHQARYATVGADDDGPAI